SRLPPALHDGYEAAVSGVRWDSHDFLGAASMKHGVFKAAAVLCATGVLLAIRSTTFLAQSAAEPRTPILFVHGICADSSLWYTPIDSSPGMVTSLLATDPDRYSNPSAPLG